MKLLPTDMGYQIELSSVNDPDIADKSAPFAIGGYINVTGPKPDSILEPGTKPDIRWTARDTIGQLTIELTGENDNPVDIITRTARDDGEWHSWTPGDDLEPGSDYQLRIKGMNRPTAYGLSAQFCIGAMVGASLGMSTIRPPARARLTWWSQNISGGVTFTLTDRNGGIVSISTPFSIPQ